MGGVLRERVLQEVDSSDISKLDLICANLPPIRLCGFFSSFISFYNTISCKTVKHQV